MRRNRPVSRRQFLTAVGQAAGRGAMLRAAALTGAGATRWGCDGAMPPDEHPFRSSARPEDWPGEVGRGRSVAIVGAGIAGMTAALELGRLGFECTLLEAHTSAGGRIRTLRAGDILAEVDSSQTCAFEDDERLYFNAGPSRIPHHHELLLGYCRALGVRLETFTNDNRAALLHDPRRLGGRPQLARQLRADLRGQLAALLAAAVERSALDAELSEAERARILTMLDVYGDLDGRSYRGSSRAGFPGQERVGSRGRGTTLDPRPISDLLDDGFLGASLAFSEGLDQQPTMLQPVGGMDRIASAFQARVEDRLVLDAEVMALRKKEEGVVVEYVEGGAPRQLEADFGLVTLPATVLRRLRHEFSSAVRAELDGFQYTSAVRVAFQSRRFWERDHNIYGGISWTAQPITQIWYPNHDFGAETGVFLGAYVFGGPAGESLSEQSPEQRLDTVIRQAAAVHPEIAAEASRGVSVAWYKVPFQLGGWGVSRPVALLEPEGRYFFAGEHLSILQGWQEGAILSSYHAIDGIVRSITS